MSSWIEWKSPRTPTTVVYAINHPRILCRLTMMGRAVFTGGLMLLQVLLPAIQPENAIASPCFSTSPAACIALRIASTVKRTLNTRVPSSERRSVHQSSGGQICAVQRRDALRGLQFNAHSWEPEGDAATWHIRPSRDFHPCALPDGISVAASK